MRKLKLLINETNECLRARNRSVSIESVNTSPEQRVARMCGTVESGRPTDGSSNERTSEESRKNGDVVKQKTNFKIGPGKSSRKSLISPPLLEPQMSQPFADSRKQLESRVISNIAAAEAIRKNLSGAQLRNEDHFSSFAVPGDENYKRIVTFTEHLKHDYVVPGTSRAAGNLKLHKMNTHEKKPPISARKGTAETPQANVVPTFPEGARHTLNAADLAPQLRTLAVPEARPTTFSKYLLLRPDLYHDTSETSMSPKAQAPSHTELLNFSDDSQDDIKGMGSLEGTKTQPTREETRPAAKPFRIVRKVIKPPVAAVAAKEGQPDARGEEIQDFPEVEAEDEKGEKSELIPKTVDESSVTVSHIDYSEMKECFHIQKGENVSLFAALSADYNGNPIRLAVHPVVLADPISIFPETCFGQ